MMLYKKACICSKPQYNSEKQNLEKNIKNVDKKTPNTSAKITEIGNKIPTITSLVAFNTKATDIESKIPNTSGLVKKKLIIFQKLKTL